MKKITLIASALALTLSSVSASDDYMFVGLNLNSLNTTIDEYGYVNAPGYSLSGESSEKISELGIGIKVGGVVDNTHRISIGVRNTQLDNDSQLKEYTLSWDYLFDNTRNFVPFIGGHINYGELGLFNDAIHDSGWIPGFQGGVLYDITPNFQLEVAGEISITAMEPDFSGYYDDGTTRIDARYNMEIGAIYNMVLGFNYKF
jgi:hypothetical protein